MARSLGVTGFAIGTSIAIYLFRLELSLAYWVYMGILFGITLYISEAQWQRRIRKRIPREEQETHQFASEMNHLTQELTDFLEANPNYALFDKMMDISNKLAELGMQLSFKLCRDCRTGGRSICGEGDNCVWKKECNWYKQWYGKKEKRMRREKYE